MRSKITLEHIVISVLAPVIALVLLASCKSPTSPTPPGPPVPEYGMVTFIETPTVPCDPASPFGNSRFVLAKRDWPPAYSGNVLYMEPQDANTWIITIKVPASTTANPFWMVYVIDRCILPSGEWVWGLVSGTGLSAEPEGHPELRVRLHDATDMTGFSFVPPDKITPR